MTSSAINLLVSISLVINAQLIMAEPSQLSLSSLSQLNLEEQLGQQIFFDTQLSSPAGQACASCHDPKNAFSDNELNASVSKGAIPGRFGTRNTPAISYALFSPDFYFDSSSGLYMGGQFIDGRALNGKAQAKGPLLNPDEMNNANAEEVINKVKKAPYSQLFQQVYGEKIFEDSNLAFDKLASALVAFEKGPIFNRFSSKYDAYLAGKVSLSPLEKQGLDIFNDEEKGNCAACHPSSTTNNSPPLFTDYSYDNLGVPANPDIIALKGKRFVDGGLGGVLQDSMQMGKFKVPSLRNIAKTAPYMHNGVFKTLQEVVDFYNTRDIMLKWDKPEVAANVNKSELGYLKMRPAEVKALLAFLDTLSDGYSASLPNYSTLNHSLSLPVVSLDLGDQRASLINVRLQEENNNGKLYYRLLAGEFQDKTLASTEPTAYFSSTTQHLEIPMLNIDANAKAIAQLKRLDTPDGYLFEVTYLKALQ